MTRREYINKLSELLSGQEQTDSEDIISYYNDYFDEVGIGEDEQVDAGMDSPQKVAYDILDGINKSEDEQGVFTETGYRVNEDIIKDEVLDINKTRRDRIGMLIIAIVIFIFALPILIPVCGTLLGVIFGLISAVIGIFFGVFAAGLGIFFGGIATLISSFAIISSYPVATIVVFGIGLILMALGIVISAVGIWIIVKFVPIATDGIKKIIAKLFNRKREII